MAGRRLSFGAIGGPFALRELHQTDTGFFSPPKMAQKPLFRFGS